MSQNSVFHNLHWFLHKIIWCLWQNKKYFIPKLTQALPLIWNWSSALGSREENLTMNSILTVYLVCKHLSVDHPVGHVEDVSGQFPRRLLIWMQNGLTGYPETHQHHQHDDHKIQHVNHLRREEMGLLLSWLMGQVHLVHYTVLLKDLMSA